MNTQSNEGAIRHISGCFCVCETEETNTGLESERGKICLTPDYFPIFLMVTCPSPFP